MAKYRLLVDTIDPLAPPAGYVDLYNKNGSWFSIDEFGTITPVDSAAAAAHIADMANPHAVTKTQVGLSNVPNTDATQRANHTGTQLASTVSDFDSAVTASTHAGSTSNPHSVTKTQVGLGNVDNTSDADKPVSTAQAAANVTDRDRTNHTGTQLASTISDFAASVLSVVLTGISFLTSSPVLATDTILVALGKLQAQITDLIGLQGPTTTLYVGPGAAYTTIQAAIDAAETATGAHVIKISPGAYTENLTISQSDIHLIGERPGLQLSIFITGTVTINHTGAGGHTFANLAVSGGAGIAFDFQSVGVNSFTVMRDIFCVGSSACVKTNNANLILRMYAFVGICTGAGGAALDLVNYNAVELYQGTVLQHISNTGVRITKNNGQIRAFDTTFIAQGVAANCTMLDLQSNSGGTLKGCTFSGVGDGVVMTGTGSLFLEEVEVFLSTASPAAHWVSGTGNLWTGNCVQLGTNFDIDVTGGIVHTALNTVPVIV